MSATRTQVYFTEQQRRALDALAKREGKTMAEVVREAVDAYVSRGPPDLELVLDRTFGSIPGLEVPARSEWDRGYA